jgi:hypothetical protein
MKKKIKRKEKKKKANFGSIRFGACKMIFMGENP